MLLHSPDFPGESAIETTPRKNERDLQEVWNLALASMSRSALGSCLANVLGALHNVFMCCTVLFAVSRMTVGCRLQDLIGAGNSEDRQVTLMNGRPS